MRARGKPDWPAGARLWLAVAGLLALAASAAADPAWMNGRIERVETHKDSRVTNWVANTPITQEEITYQVAVHVKNQVLVGEYRGGERQLPPPEEWTANYPVRVALDGNTMFLAPSAGDTLKLRIVKRKAAAMMAPLSAEEQAILEHGPAAPQNESPVGFITPQEHAADQQKPAAAPAPEAASQNAGTVEVTSVPYLAEVLVDGASMGYTPAKLKLPPGKHSFQVQKAGYKSWSKQIVVTAGSELRLDATLAK